MQFHKLLIHVSSLHCERRRRQFYELNLSDGQPKVLANLLIMEVHSEGISTDMPC